MLMVYVKCILIYKLLFFLEILRYNVFLYLCIFDIFIIFRIGNIFDMYCYLFFFKFIELYYICICIYV